MMISKHVAQGLDHLAASLQSIESPLGGILYSIRRAPMLEKMHSSPAAQILAILDTPEPEREASLKSLRKAGDEISQVLRRLSPRDVFRAVYDAEQLIGDFWHSHGSPERAFGVLLQHLKDFEQAYEAFLSKATNGTALEIYQIAKSLEHTLDLFRQNIHAFSSLLKEQREMPEGNSSLDLVFFSSVALDDIQGKLSALEELYVFLAEMMNVSTADFPLRVQELEIGSLWVKIFGETRIIQMMEDFIRAAAGFVYRRFTNEGRMSAISSQLDTLERVLKFSETLEAKGVSPEEVRANVERAAVTISKQLNTLLSGEASVEVNDTRYAPADTGLIQTPEAPRLLGPGSTDGEEI